MTIRRKVIPR